MQLMYPKNKVKIIEESNSVCLSKKLQMILLHTLIQNSSKPFR